MPEVQPEVVIPADPAFMSDKEFLRAAQYRLDQSKHLPWAWQVDLVKRLEAHVR